MNTDDAPRSTLPLFALAASLAGLALGIHALVQTPPAPTAFDMNSAMEAAGQHVPERIESFYFFVPEVAKSHDDEVQELSGLLARAASEGDYIGIAGPDTERNLAELLAALKAHRAQGLKGLVLIYLGPESHRGNVETAVTESGASVKFVVYPSAPSNAI